MKTNRLLRVLSLLAFLLLIAPFYDSCNGHGRRTAETNAAPAADSVAVDDSDTLFSKKNNVEIDYDNFGNQPEQPFYKKIYEFVDDDKSENAFEFARLSIDCVFDFNYKEFKHDIKKKEGYEGIFFQLKNFCFLLIVLVTFLNAILSFKDTRLLTKFSRLNLILLLITIFCLFLEGLFETITQIKWGYYAFLITNLLIFYYSGKCQKQT